MTALSACPGCAAAPAAIAVASEATKDEVILSVPNARCAACISAIEGALLKLPHVRSARVNLSRKRVVVDAAGLSSSRLIAAINQAGHEAYELDAHMMAAVETDPAGHALLLRIAVAGFAMMNVMLFSIAVWSGAAEATRTVFHWISAAIAVPALAFSAEVFVKEAWSALRKFRLNMDVPISLAIVLAAGLSLYETSAGSGHVYFDAALSLTFFLLIGRYLDHRARIATRSAAQELSALIQPLVVRIKNGSSEQIKTSALDVGDMVRVFPGDRVPVDGVVIAGQSDVDRSVLTGESVPARAIEGDRVTAGEILVSGQLDIRATAVGRNTSLAQIADMVEAAEGMRNSYTALADKAAQFYAPAVHLTALVTFLGWMIVSADFPLSLNIAISVLIITCPCALGLAVPAVMTAATGRLFRLGLLVKNGTALERMADIDTVVFDKTGTLTMGRADIDLGEFSNEQLSILAALSRASKHPVSVAIAAALPKHTTSAPVEGIEEVQGFGVKGLYNGQTVRLGGGFWMESPNATAFCVGDMPPRSINFRETLRPGAVEVVGELIKRGLQVHIFSGDHKKAVEKVSRTLGVEQVGSRMLPADKLARLSELRDKGRRVLMIGDGLNDTLALAQADVSISPASALDASRAASDIVVMGRSLAGVIDVLDTATAAKRRIVENFVVAAGYNMIAIPIAVLGFSTPLYAAIAMSASSITVLLNALRVR